MCAFFYNPEKSLVLPDLNQALRYLGYGNSSCPTDDVLRGLEKCMEELHSMIAPQSVYEEFSLSVDGTEISFADMNISSVHLAKNLKGCDRVVLFAATIGPMVDARIRRAQAESSVEAAMFHAAGAMFVESFVDGLNGKLKEEYGKKGCLSHPRYSPGYGDVSLSVQNDFFRLLPAKRIGLTLMRSLVMAPEKSVTAFIGFEKMDGSSRGL